MNLKRTNVKRSDQVNNRSLVDEVERDRKVPWLDSYGDLWWRCPAPRKRSSSRVVLLEEFFQAWEIYQGLWLPKSPAIEYKPRQLPRWKPVKPNLRCEK
jgi:hypothetical protein